MLNHSMYQFDSIAGAKRVNRIELGQCVHMAKSAARDAGVPALTPLDVARPAGQPRRQKWAVKRTRRG
jgi:hypothetical protein